MWMNVDLIFSMQQRVKLLISRNYAITPVNVVSVKVVALKATEANLFLVIHVLANL